MVVEMRVLRVLVRVHVWHTKMSLLEGEVHENIEAFPMEAYVDQPLFARSRDGHLWVMALSCGSVVAMVEEVWVFHKCHVVVERVDTRVQDQGFVPSACEGRVALQAGTWYPCTRET